MSRRKLPAAGPEIRPFPGGDGAVLREWLQTAGIIRRGPLPKKEGCTELALHIAGIWNTFRHRGPASPLRQLERYIEEVGPALETLTSVLPGWTAHLRRDLETAHEPSLPQRIHALMDVGMGLSLLHDCAVPQSLETLAKAAEEDLNVLQALYDAAVAARARLHLENLHELPSIDRWHDYVIPVADAFRKVVCVGLGNSGPLSRFLVGVIPYISGEAPSEDDVMRYLQRKANSNKT